jgi:hypothetical protein
MITQEATTGIGQQIVRGASGFVVTKGLTLRGGDTNYFDTVLSSFVSRAGVFWFTPRMDFVTFLQHFFHTPFIARELDIDVFLTSVSPSVFIYASPINWPRPVYLNLEIQVGVGVFAMDLIQEFPELDELLNKRPRTQKTGDSKHRSRDSHLIHTLKDDWVTMRDQLAGFLCINCSELESDRTQDEQSKDYCLGEDSHGLNYFFLQ